MKSHVKIALTAGGMYEALYARIPEFERITGITVAVEFAGTHPELNAHLAALDPVPYHLVSTHTKYAASQLRFLAPIEGFDTLDFFPPVLDLAKIGGALYGIPRNIDLQLLHYRTDIIETPPATWDELVALAKRATHAPGPYGFVFTGMESGLFGTFFELAESAGARIFSSSLLPEVNNDRGRSTCCASFTRAAPCRRRLPDGATTRSTRSSAPEVRRWCSIGPATTPPIAIRRPRCATAFK